jgi:nucleotide-binding universal stress UspA family protein
MFKHILLPTDGSKLSDKAVKQAISVAGALGAKITAVNVVGEYHLHLQDEGFDMPEIPALKKRFEEAEAARAKKILDAVRKSASEAGVECDAVTATSDVPYEAIIKQAKKSGCDLIIMASHGYRGIKGILLGSETSKVLTHSKIPVLVVR